MKKLKVLVAWIIVSLLIQSSVYIFLNYFIFKNDGNVSSKKVELKKEDVSKIANISVSNNMENLKFSFDGKFMSYVNGKELSIVNVRDGKQSTVESNVNYEFLNYIWLSDRNRILTAEVNKSSRMLSLFYYDAAKNEKNKISDITKIDSSSKITEIKASTLTDVTYVMIQNAQDVKSVYRIDINKTLSKVNIKTTNILDIDVIPHEDRLIYDEENSKELYATGPNKTFTFDNKEVALLCTNSEDVVYVGEMENEEVTKIKYGKLNEDVATWKEIQISKPIKKENVLVSTSGEVYIMNKDNNTLEDISKNKKHDLKGEILGVFDKGYFYIENGKLAQERF